MINGKIEHNTFEAQNIFSQQLVKPFTNLYKQTVVVANIRIFNEYYEEIRRHLKRLMVKVLFNLQEQSKELKLKIE